MNTSKAKPHYKSKEMIEFANRVNHALDRMGFPSKYGGRQTLLGKQLAADQRGVGRWLEGKGYPSSENMRKLAEFVGEDKSYLRYGEGQSKHEKRQLSVTHRQGNVTFDGASPDASAIGFVPLVKLTDIEQILNTETKGRIPSPPVGGVVTDGSSQVEGSSMTRPESPSYPNGSYIYWRRALDASIGDHVIAKLGDGSIVFRELDSDGSSRVLKPLNGQYPMITCAFSIIAVITGKYEPVLNIKPS